MIKEIAQFTQNLSEDFKNLGVKPKEGLHILLKIVEIDDTLSLDLENIQYELYTKKMLVESDFLRKCMFLSLNAWMIDTNKCFDAPAKAIHSCSPYCVGFKREHLEGGEKYTKNRQDKKKQIDERFDSYFNKALALFGNETDKSKGEVFKSFFIQKDSEKYFKTTFDNIQIAFAEKRQIYSDKAEALKEGQKNASQEAKVTIKQDLDSLLVELERVKELTDSDYIIFYLDEPLEKYKEVHQRYLADKLFNTSEYNTKPNNLGEIFGTSDFFNGFNTSMPFLIHQTAPFEIAGRISDREAKFLYEFKQILPRKTLPKPLPIFLFKEELQKKVIGIFKDSDNKLGYKEIIESLWGEYQNDFGNYYLLFYDNTKDGLVFKDFDFVSKFEYELKDENDKNWQIENLFEINEKDSKQLKKYPKLSNIFDLEMVVFNTLLSNKYNKMEYFNELDSASYEKMDFTFLAYSKYRKAVYDFVYKSNRTAIQHIAFSEMVFNGVKDDIKHNRSFAIKEKLNIWFSLYENFNLNYKPNSKTMASKLKEYQQIVDELAEDKANLEDVSVEQFAFAAGQVIYYILQKSKSADQSYQRLEPYLQQVSCEGIKKAIANDFARYKHENYSSRFECVSAFVLTYQTPIDMKKVLPEILAGIFSNNQLFPKKKETSENNN